ncbi:MAG: COX15/CtaA family protein [Halobacteriales archaeon]
MQTHIDRRALGRRYARHLAVTTAAATFALILLGVYTAATGSGLGCSAQWPLCDGGLLPQSVPSLIEWLHRFVALITGGLILGLAYVGWRHYDERRIHLALGLAVIALPLQILLGGATVVEYTPVIQTAHHAAALVIFTAVLAATLWILEAGR